MRIGTRRALKYLQLVLSVGAHAVTIGIPLLGLLLGIVHLPQGYGLLSKPGPVLTLIYIGLWLGWIWIGYSLLRVVKRRSVNKPNETNFKAVMYVITTPLAALWILTWGELLGWPQSGPGSSYSDGDSAIALFIFGGGALIFGGEIVATVAVSIDKFFNPNEYPEEPQQSA